MPLPLRTITTWLERHREKLIDAGLLALALNYSGLFTGTPPPPWSAQLILLIIFAVLTSPRAHLIPGLWQRYLRLLPGHAATAVAGLLLLVWWFNLPRDHAWFAPIWLALTALARLPMAGPVRRAADHFRLHRLDIICMDLVWLAGFSIAVPRWCLRPGPAPLAVALLGLGWIAWHWMRGGHDPAQAEVYRRRSWTLLGLALAWGMLWLPAAGTGPAVIYTGWLGAGLLVTRLMAGRFAASTVDGCGEVMRWLGLVAVVTFVFHPFASGNARGADDARFYATFLADALTQFRQGVFPVLVGQSEYQFNGGVVPIRIAPAFQYAGGLLDVLTARTLGTLAVENMLIALTALAAAASSYACLRRTTLSASVAWMLAMLFLTCPGVLSLVFVSDLYMSWLTVPWVPVVVYLCCRSFSTGGAGLFAGLGFSLGITWWMHAPVALWLTLLASGLQLARLIWRRPAWGLLPAELAAGAIAFLTTAAYPLVSGILYPIDPATGASGGFVVPAPNILQQLLDTFPAAWLPVSTFGRVISDFQIGYGLLAVGLVVLPAAWHTRRVELRGLVVAAALLLLLLVPVPRLNLLLWELVPEMIRVVTNTWVMQRLYLLLAGCLVLLAGATWAATRPTTWLHWVLIAACCWSGLETTKFIRGSRAIIGPREKVSTFLLPENITLTRYSYGLFAAKPAYFTHGATDPVLENRFLAADLQTVTGGNQAAASRVARTDKSPEYFLTRSAEVPALQATFTLLPGRRYLAELVSSADPFPAATLILKGATLERIYGLPEYGEARSFGLGGERVPFFTLHTSSTRTENIIVQLFPADQAGLPVLDGRVRLRLAEYDASALPVQIRSWIPYAATVRTDDSVWLETPRMYQAGYVAEVAGRPAEVRRSAQGLASVPVPAGTSEVVLRYRAPAGLLGAFWLSLGAMGAGILVALFAGWRELRAGAAARVTPAAPSP